MASGTAAAKNRRLDAIFDAAVDAALGAGPAAGPPPDDVGVGLSVLDAGVGHRSDVVIGRPLGRSAARAAARGDRDDRLFGF